MQWEEPPRHIKEGHGRVPPALLCVAVYFVFISFIVIFIIVQKSIYHNIKEYIFTTHYNKFEDYEEVLPILVTSS